MRNPQLVISLIVFMSYSSANAADKAYSKARTTVFYTAKVKGVDPEMNCTKPVKRKGKVTHYVPDTKSNVLDKKGNVLATLCTKDYKKCRMEGSCLVQSEDGNKLINVANRKGTKWSIIDQDKCKYGTGAVIKNEISCLIPYKSVACAPGVKAGTVVYIDEAVDLSYQVDNGPVLKHDGHFICSDTGGLITGAGRFDIFTGYEGEPKNEFLNAGFGDKNIGKFHYKYVRPGKINENNRIIADLQNLVLTSGANSTIAADAGRSIASGDGAR